MSGRNVYRVIILLLLVFTFAPRSMQAAPSGTVDAKTRCSVCGMFVAEYENWLSLIRLSDDSVMFFDGVKDLMVLYHNPKKYSWAEPKDIQEIWVKDYYSLDWIEGRKALYVIGSDVYGPMGKEFIPFARQDAAENFLQDHKGKKIITFDDITGELVQSMRSGMKMRHGSK